MHPHVTYSATQLFVRSLLPSVTSGLACVGVGCALLFGHLLLLSVRFGTSLPNFFDGQWAITYTDRVVQPLQSGLHNLTFNNVMIIVLWGVAGLGVYSLVGYGVQTYKEWREAQRDVQFTGQRIVRHPLREAFIKDAAWRVAVVCAAVLFFVSAHPLIQRSLAAAPGIVLGELSVGAGLREMVLAVAIWAVFAHCCVVLLRLYARRTRLFGADLYK